MGKFTDLYEQKATIERKIAALLDETLEPPVTSPVVTPEVSVSLTPTATTTPTPTPSITPSSTTIWGEQIIYPPSYPFMEEIIYVGKVGTSNLFKISFDDEKSRSYLNINNGFFNVGINIYDNPNFKIKNGLNINNIKTGIVDTITGNNGLDPDPFSFTFHKTEPIDETPIDEEPNKNFLISVPMGVISWDNWERDYWNDSNASEDDLNRNHIGLNRLAASEWKYKFKTVPFWGQHTAPEKIKIRHNVEWSDELRRNIYEEAEKTVTVKFDKTPADTDREVKYYADAGFKWICFNYYSDISYLSNTRRQFVDMPNKYGMKMTFMLADKREDYEVDYIANLMMQDYWFRIDGKPVLYLDTTDYLEVNRYRSAYRSKGGGEIYEVYYSMNGIPQDVNDLFSKRPKAVSTYNNTTSYGIKAKDLMRSEVEDRQNFVNQFKASNIKIIPNITLGFEQLGLRTSMGDQGRPGVEIATLDEIEEKCQLLYGFIEANPNEVPAVLWYAGNEILEGGESLVPKRLVDGSIDTSTIDTVSKYIKK